MRVVLDTNVLVSGALFGGVPGEILEAWRDGRLTLVMSTAVFEEYEQVASRLAATYGSLDLEPLLALVALEGEFVEAPMPKAPISRDPDDDKFLVCARAGGADIVVSGDADLLSIGVWKGIRVLSPREYVEELAK